MQYYPGFCVGIICEEYLLTGGYRGTGKGENSGGIHGIGGFCRGGVTDTPGTCRRITTIIIAGATRERMISTQGSGR